MWGPLALEPNLTSSGVYIPLHVVSLAVSTLTLGCTLVIGLLGNGLVCWVVYTNKYLQTPNNTLLLNLAVTDLLKCILDIPSFLLTSTWGNSHTDLGEALCLLQPFTYSLSSCVQLVTLAAISAERYQAIANPFQAAKRKTRVKVWISLIWPLGLILSVFSISLAKDTPVYLRCRHRLVNAQNYIDPFGSYILVPVWIVSLSLIVVHYLRIFALVRQHSNRIFDDGIMPTTSEQRELQLPGSAWHSIQQTPLAKLSNTGQVHHSHIAQLKSGTCPALHQVSSMNDCASVPNEIGLPNTPNIVGAVCLITSRSRECIKKRMEGKLAKRFGYIILTFLVFWVPLVIVLMLNVVLQDGFLERPLLLEFQTLGVALTCVPAAVNPFIYTMLNQQVNSEIQKILNRLRRSCEALISRP
ncbi:5-hydroxytryptamine receptor 1D-like [Scyliorhinus torazame]|uniref:5-hydroxytryptamine receptor 1D-like n=1 Tax=Scyliorhinus torazame TaxID=75743 RepID=UPI003B5C9E39